MKVINQNSMALEQNNIIGTTEISHEIEKMIDESYKVLIFISPFLKITNRLKAKLSNSFQNLDSCFFIYRKNELRNDEKAWVSSFNNVHLIGVDNLHAKIYLNDKRSIITSMNFYEYSQINNYEIGVIIDRKDDNNGYQKILEEVLLITKLSDNYLKISKVLEPFQNYTAGKLFLKLCDISGRYSDSKSLDWAYKTFCNDARKVIEFLPAELYEDGTAILRTANLGKERYALILNSLK
jgi:phosphatidylserine/phosphatidylglycerophosphate/cardiolipin synthase-like enzyme